MLCLTVNCPKSSNRLDFLKRKVSLSGALHSSSHSEMASEKPQNTCCIGEALIVLALPRLDFSFKIIFFFFWAEKSVSRHRLKREKKDQLEFFWKAHSGKYFEYTKARTKNRKSK